MITKKFYVGSEKVFISKTYGPYLGKWAKDTMEEAVDQAKEILQNNPEQDSCFIVEIVAVVKREYPPVRVIPVV